jgi:hypothetical protein
VSDPRPLRHAFAGLAVRGLALPLALAVLWRAVVWTRGIAWPHGRDALFSTDLPAVLAGLALARALAGGAASGRLRRAEWWLCLGFLPAAALPLLRLAPPTRGTAASLAYAALVLAWSVPTLYVAARFLLAETRPTLRGSGALFLALVSIYVALGRHTCHVAAPTGDEPHYLMVAHSLWQDGDLDLANNFEAKEYLGFYPAPFGPRPWDIRTPEGRIYSWGGPLFPALLAVPYGLGGRSGAVLLVNLITALAVLGAYRLARALGGAAAPSLAGALAAGLTLPVLAFSSLLYPETLAGLLGITALRLALRPAGMLPAFAVLLGLTLIRAKYLALALPMALVLGRGAHARVLLGFLGLVGAYLLLDAWALNGEYSGRLGTYFSSSHTYALTQSQWQGLPGIWLDQESGILPYSPLLLALFLLAVPLARHHRTGQAIAAAALLYCLAVGVYPVWFAEWSYPGRFLVPVVLLLGATGAAARLGPRMDPLAGAAALHSGVAAVALILFPALAYNYADGTASALEALEKLLGLPVCRFFPSFVRPTELAQGLAVVVAAGLCTAVVLRRPRERAGFGRAAAAALSGTLLLAAVWCTPLWANRLIRTTVIEAEDALVRTRGGRLWPDARPYYLRAAMGELRLGLRLPPGTRLEADVDTPGGAVGFLVTGTAEGCTGRADVSLNRTVRGSIELPEGAWGPYGVYTLKRKGPRPLEIHNTGECDLVIDRIDVTRP